MIELTYNGATVTVPANNDVPFNAVMKSGCAERYEANTNTLTLVKAGRYLVSASANIAVPTGGVVGPVTLGIASNGSIINGTTMAATPTVAGAFFNVATQTYVDVYPCSSKTIALRAGIAPVDVNNQNLTAVRVNG